MLTHHSLIVGILRLQSCIFNVSGLCAIFLENVHFENASDLL